MSSTVADSACSPKPLEPGRTRRQIRPSAIWLVIPGVAFLTVAFLLPLILLLSQSVYDNGFTLRHFERILTTQSYLAVIWTSIKIAVLSTAITIALAYPISCYLMRVGPTKRSVMMALIIIPFWTNILVRCYAWIVILQKARAGKHFPHKSARRDYPAVRHGLTTLPAS